MLSPAIPNDETERLAALQRYCVLDTMPEPAFDRLTHILQYMLGVPTVLVSLVDANRQWFKSRIGLDATETPRDISFCGHTIVQREPLIVPDAREDVRFFDNPLVAGPMGVRFYAGAPLLNSEGLALGTLCAIDYAPRPALTPEEVGILSGLADAVVSALELRAAAETQAARAKLSLMLGQVANTAHHAADMHSALGPVLAEVCAYVGASIGHVYLRESDNADNFVSSGVWHFGGNAGVFNVFRDSTHSFSTLATHVFPDDVLKKASSIMISDTTQEPVGSRAALAAAVGLRKGLIFPIEAGGVVHGVVECYGERRSNTPAQYLVAVAEYVGAHLSRLAERERVARLKDEFISTVSHELRTPLTSIAGALELLDGGVAGELPGGAREMVGIAHHNSQRLIRLVNDILDIEKMESGSMTFDLQPKALAPLVRRAITEITAFAQTMDVRLAFDVADPEAMAAVDPDRFIQVMINLLSNAAKFSPSRQAVTVTLLKHDSKMLRVSVADRGPGIPEAFRRQIFGKFAQADGTDNRRCAGTGLGLAIAKKIIEFHDGVISFETEMGRGTVFHVDLPLYVEARVEEPLCQAAA
jgi:signal transduction histidine kinase